MTRTEWTDRRVENIVGNLLRTGVILSAVVVLAGGLIFLVRHGAQPTNYRVFQGEPSELRHLRGIIRGVLALHSRAIIQLGLLLLIATPIARVAFSVFGFAEEKDRMYMAFTGIVLVILLYSLMGSA
jgi:uncharacterized membrane protein